MVACMGPPYSIRSKYLKIESPKERTTTGVVGMLIRFVDVLVSLQFENRGLNLARHSGDFLGVFVLSTRPKKSLQTISFSARNNMYMKMRHTLADTIVGGNEGPFGFHGLLDGVGELAGIQKERANQRVGQIGNGFQMRLGYEQTMSG